MHRASTPRRIRGFQKATMVVPDTCGTDGFVPVNFACRVLQDGLARWIFKLRIFPVDKISSTSTSTATVSPAPTPHQQRAPRTYLGFTPIVVALRVSFATSGTMSCISCFSARSAGFSDARSVPFHAYEVEIVQISGLWKVACGRARSSVRAGAEMLQLGIAREAGTGDLEWSFSHLASGCRLVFAGKTDKRRGRRLARVLYIRGISIRSLLWCAACRAMLLDCVLRGRRRVADVRTEKSRARAFPVRHSLNGFQASTTVAPRAGIRVHSEPLPWAYCKIPLRFVARRPVRQCSTP
ncbi:hypothetical protein B0H13DRAFT_1941049 [Mycena leptocephala]|nr:hypothetical protein B0H13DRAFT_1941049 [Mycena leptocephala]